jgi:hypothetical protein
MQASLSERCVHGATDIRSVYEGPGDLNFVLVTAAQCMSDLGPQSPLQRNVCLT